ncbi:DUF6152 family protein [Ramlibacter tataouinensis]|uniref:Uncharacterized protein n=1 Tax=Ramlibacter tataouinensis (strain ATCC BAA-407 / DSM 14655 / LMG 21543 / TTB310) TaxID=365046 RepID=F5XZT1_RAMTT|nr:DUF6152 family protein [Ramlibacter tataouinensis]AEG93292.1 Conserved hypothetical protein [Ramlibacter tataouinensis TTB310]
MKRRTLVLAGVAVPGLALAHHGWSSFDQDRPVWLEGKVSRVRWQNPHAELELDIASNLRVPADLASRPLPPQSAPVDGKALLSRAVVPTRKDARWEVELAPLTRMEAWKVAEIKPGATVGVLGFTFKEEKGDPVLRAEYLFVDGKTYGLRSSPA